MSCGRPLEGPYCLKGAPAEWVLRMLRRIELLAGRVQGRPARGSGQVCRPAYYTGAPPHAWRESTAPNHRCA
jgi:hypothetical protein